MTDAINPILQWLNVHPNWAGLAIFLISAAESVAIIGTIIPGTVMMTAIGTLAGASVIPLWPTIFLAIIGAIAGDGISYLIGSHFKTKLYQIWPFRNNPAWLDKGNSFFKKHGGKSIFIGRFVGPVRAIVPVIAGTLGMKPLRFFSASIPAAIAWAPVYMLPGILIGAVSLELPPDLAVHAILKLFLATLFIILCVWLTIKIFLLIGYQVEQTLNNIWKKLENSRYASVITIALKHHNPLRTHGQLVLAFYFIAVSICFGCLSYYIAKFGSESIFINNAIFHWCRSLRTPGMDSIMLAITSFGDKHILAPVICALFLWLYFNKRRYLAWHVFALGLLSFGCIEGFKHLIHSPRPWGIQQSPESYSFPSGHTTLSTTFYVGFALLLSINYPFKRRIFVIAAVVIAFLTSISRLYLGAHWFTDVTAGWLLSTALLLLISISYNRKKDITTSLNKMMIVVIAVFCLSYGFNTFHSFHHLKQNYQLAEYPVYDISINSWWEQTNANDPIYRINRFGIADQVLNIQWIDRFETISHTLLENGWEAPPERDWISVVQRLSDVKSSDHLPLVSPLYLDKKPVLVLVKRTDDKKRVMVLRFWDSNINIAPQHSELHLWVGTITMIPRTYSWIFKKTADEINLTSSLLFHNTHHEYDIKEISVSPTLSHKKYKIAPIILLVKPKTLLTH